MQDITMKIVEIRTWYRISVTTKMRYQTLLRQIKMKMRKQRPGPISMQRHSETCSQHYTIEFEVRQIPSSEIIERVRFLHVFWNVD